MKTLFVLTVVAATLVAISSTKFLHKDLLEEWKLYKQAYNKTYKWSHTEVARRLSWYYNRQKIQEHNARADLGLHSYRMAVNQFTDQRTDEVLSKFRIKHHQGNRNTFGSNNKLSELPDAVDWSSKGCVSPVRNQGVLGSPSAIAATGSIEGLWAIKTGTLTPLSYQQIADCSKSNNVQQAFESVIATGGIMSLADYANATGTCHFDPKKSVCSLTGYEMVARNETSLQAAVATVGPITIEVDASKFLFYSSGIFYDPTCNDDAPNHALLVTGYGSENGQDFWIAKNSWGVAWGEKGFIRLRRNANNLCGVASYASYPVLA